jgi:hypothetical protein
MYQVACVGCPANFATAGQQVVGFYVVAKAWERLSIFDQIASGAKEAASGADTFATNRRVDDEDQMNRQRPNPVILLAATLSDTEGASISARVTKTGFDFIAAARVRVLAAGSRQPLREVTVAGPDIAVSRTHRSARRRRIDHARPSFRPRHRTSSLQDTASVDGRAAANSAQFGRNVASPTPLQIS